VGKRIPTQLESPSLTRVFGRHRPHRQRERLGIPFAERPFIADRIAGLL
jgi:hypothetical protein